MRRLAQRLAATAGRRLDDAMPFVDVVLPDGSRVHAVLPPLTRNTTISLRVLARRPLDLAGLVSLDAMPAEVAELLRDVVAARLAFVVARRHRQRARPPCWARCSARSMPASGCW